MQMVRIRLALLAVAVVSPLSAPPTAEGAETLRSVARALPAEIAGLRRQGEDELYTPTTIFRYLDGGAEVYLAYGLRGCLARHYVGSGTEVTVDLFEMPSSRDAFGIFSHDQDGEEMSAGQGALLRPGWLSFWKDRFFVSLSADRDDAEVRAVLRELARTVAAAIPGEGLVPELVARLPTAGRLPRSVRYLHDPVILATHLDLGPDNPLRLGAETEAALARYRRGGSGAALLLVRFPSDARAAEAAASAWAAVLGGAAGAVPMREAAGRWRGLQAAGAMLALVVEADDRDLAATLLGEALAEPAPADGKSGVMP